MVGLRGVEWLALWWGSVSSLAAGSPFGGEVDLGSDEPTLRGDLVWPRGGPRLGGGGLVIFFLLTLLHVDRVDIEFGVK
jgi:hypothetical protein